MASLIVNCQISKTFENDYDSLNRKVPNFHKILETTIASLIKKCRISTKFGDDYNILKDTSVRNSRNQSYLNAIASEIIQNHSLFISDLV